MTNDATLKGKRICIIDDQADNVYVMLTLLKQAGATGIVVWWSADEIQKIQQHFPVDMVLLDLMMPGLRSGFKVITELREIPELVDVPVVAVSASDAATAIPLAREQGFNGYISKPINADSFAPQIKAIFAGEEVWRGR